MIPRELDAITETDLQTLCDVKRAEDERIEFKKSFKGGLKLLDMPESQKDKAIASLAKEAVAFLNHHGGDIVVGVSEDNDGAAGSLNPIDDAAQVAERLRRSLNDRIEPQPRSMRVRCVPVAKPDEKTGYIVIRSEASLQAPHRLVQSKEFFVRKGTEAAPMDIIAIHDSVLRTSTEAKRVEDHLNEQLKSVHRSIANNRNLNGPGFQARIVFTPLQHMQINLDQQTLEAVQRAGNSFYEQGKKIENDVAFRGLTNVRWRPVLRGKIVEHWFPSENTERSLYASKGLYQDGTIVFDWFARNIPDNIDAPIIVFEWFQGFLSEACHALKNFEKATQLDANFVIGLAMRIEPLNGNLPRLTFGRTVFEDEFLAFPELDRIYQLPFFHIRNQDSYAEFFQQAQKDLLHICATDREVASLYV